jgi:hypothetical protein
MGLKETRPSLQSGFARPLAREEARAERALARGDRTRDPHVVRE